MTTLPSRAITRAELDAMPADGRRYELIDGVLVVTPAPSPRHQVVLSELHFTLKSACPENLRVLFAPLDVALSEDSVLQPDLLVAPRAAFTARDLPGAPLLAVEVLSPSTHRVDLTLKLSRYETAGCASYWVVDPVEPSLTVWELEDDGYVQRAHAVGDQSVRVAAPFDVTFTPAALLN